MAQNNPTSTVSVEQLIQDSLKDLAQNIDQKYGIQIKGVRIMWRDLSTAAVEGKRVSEVYLEVEKSYR